MLKRPALCLIPLAQAETPRMTQTIPTSFQRQIPDFH